MSEEVDRNILQEIANKHKTNKKANPRIGDMTQTEIIAWLKEKGDLQGLFQQAGMYGTVPYTPEEIHHARFNTEVKDFLKEEMKDSQEPLSAMEELDRFGIEEDKFDYRPECQCYGCQYHRLELKKEELIAASAVPPPRIDNNARIVNLTPSDTVFEPVTNAAWDKLYPKGKEEELQGSSQKVGEMSREEKDKLFENLNASKIIDEMPTRKIIDYLAEKRELTLFGEPINKIHLPLGHKDFLKPFEKGGFSSQPLPPELFPTPPAPSPVGGWFNDIDREFDELEMNLFQLIDKINPCLTPQMTGQDNGTGKDVPESSLSSLEEKLKDIACKLANYRRIVFDVKIRVTL